MLVRFVGAPGTPPATAGELRAFPTETGTPGTPLATSGAAWPANGTRNVPATMPLGRPRIARNVGPEFACRGQLRSPHLS